MNYVTLGKTGLKAAVVSFGGIPIQRADGANTKAVVDKLEALRSWSTESFPGLDILFLMMEKACY